LKREKTGYKERNSSYSIQTKEKRYYTIEKKRDYSDKRKERENRRSREKGRGFTILREVSVLSLSICASTFLAGRGGHMLMRRKVFFSRQVKGGKRVLQLEPEKGGVLLYRGKETCEKFSFSCHDQVLVLLKGRSAAK